MPNGRAGERGLIGAILMCGGDPISGSPRIHAVIKEAAMRTTLDLARVALFCAMFLVFVPRRPVLALDPRRG